MARPRHRAPYAYEPVPNLSDWSVRRVRSALCEHEEGIFWQSALLAEHMERNPRIMGALNTRTLALHGLPFEIEPGDGDKRRADSVARELLAVWSKVAPEDVLQQLHRWALLLGVAFAEIVWDTRAGRWTPRLVPVHPSFVRWDIVTDRYLVRTIYDGEVPIEPNDGNWLVLSYSRTRAWMRGVVRCLALDDTLRAFAVRDWARWSEKHGLPITAWVVPAQSVDKDKDEIAEEAEALGSESVVVLPQDPATGRGYDLKTVEPQALSWEGFDRQIDRVAVDVAIAIQGQNLTTEVKSGSFAAAKVHDRVRNDYIEADVVMFATGTHEQVHEPWALFNFGDAELAPWACWDATPPEDKKASADTLSAAGDALKKWNAELRSVGLEVDPEPYALRFGVPVRKLAAGAQPPEPTAPAPAPAQEN